MKQAIDNKTIDMFGNIPDPTVYMFYVETHTGECIEWRGLTLAKAKQMYAYTSKHTPDNVVRSGWEALK